MGLSHIRDGGNNYVVNNTIESLEIYRSVNNVLKNNSIRRNFEVHGDFTYEFIQNIDSSNVYKGHPLLYICNDDGLNDIYNYDNIRYVGLTNCSNFIIDGSIINISNINLRYCDNITIKNIKLTNSIGRLYVKETSNMYLYNSFFSHNMFDAIIFLSSDNNVIYNNSITHSGYAICFYNSKSNVIINNNFSNNNAAFYIGGNCTENNVYHNVYSKNKKIIEYSDSFYLYDPIWEDGSNRGNFWSDYGGVDADGDGIGDTPYIIDEANQDNFPLMSPIDFSTTPIEADGNVQPPVEEPSESTEEEGEGTTSEETTQPTQESEEPEEPTETEPDGPVGIPGFPALAILSGLILGLAMTRKR
jgi:parallel beta-helix repeat protein